MIKSKLYTKRLRVRNKVRQRIGTQNATHPNNHLRIDAHHRAVFVNRTWQDDRDVEHNLHRRCYGCRGRHACKIPGVVRSQEHTGPHGKWPHACRSIVRWCARTGRRSFARHARNNHGFTGLYPAHPPDQGWSEKSAEKMV